jgi:hypothetical protein
MEETFVKREGISKIVLAQRFRTIKAVVSARHVESRTERAASERSNLISWIPGISNPTMAGDEDDASSDHAVEDGDSTVADKVKSLPTLPWIQSTKLSTVQESDEETDDYASSAGSCRSF